MLQVGDRQGRAAVVGQGVGQRQAAQARGARQAGRAGGRQHGVAAQVQILQAWQGVAGVTTTAHWWMMAAGQHSGVTQHAGRVSDNQESPGLPGPLLACRLVDR